MHDNETIALLRDLFIIIVSGLLIVILLGLGIFALGTVRRIGKIVRQVETITGVTANTVSNLGAVIVSSLEVLVKRLLGMLKDRKSEETDGDGDK